MGKILSKHITVIITLLSFVIIGMGNVMGQISMTSSPTTYTENFDALDPNSPGTNVTWTNNTTIPGWYTNQTNYRSWNTGDAAPTNRFWSCGSSTASTDRALGSMMSSTTIRSWGVELTNNTGSTLNDLTIGLDAENYIVGGTGSDFLIQYSLSSTNLSDVFTSASWTTIATLSGATATGLSYSLSSLGLANGSTITIRFASKYSGSSSNYTLWATDNFTASWGVTPNVTNPAIANQSTPCIAENSANGTAVYTVIASDADPGQSVTAYSITAGNTGSVFAIDNSGNITVNGLIDYETHPAAYTLTVQACDNGSPVLCSTATITICVTDVLEVPNNNDPVITNAGVARSVAEGSDGGTAVGSALTATDADGNSVTFSITGGNTGTAFYINPTTGQIYVNGFLDRETISSYTLQITATDDGSPSRSSVQNVTISITDVVETSPYIDAWYGTCSGTTVPIYANVVGATFAGWKISPSGATTDITSPSSASTTVTNHTSSVTYIASAIVPTGANLVTNGDFEAGNTVSGFSSSYTYKSGSVGNPGEYGITQDADASQSYFVSSPDHTPSGSWYLYADGSNSSGAVIYSTTVSVTSGLSYAFSAWFANGHDGTVNSSETAHLEFRVNGSYAGDVTLPLDVGVWHQFTSAYTATSTGSITIEIVNRNTNSTKNDFFLDDIVFQQGTLLTSSITVPTCTPPLPVELLNFTGREDNGNNVVTWNTASEQNNSHFVIERSSNGSDFVAVGTVQGHGNSSATLTYYFVDEQPSNGTNYYRLKQVDFNGTSAYSNTIALDNNKQVDIDIYPNPNNGAFTINLFAPAQSSYALDITDVIGRVVYSNSGEIVPVKVEVNSLARGMYIISFHIGEQTVVKKLVVY